jgi:hypothetical protein
LRIEKSALAMKTMLETASSANVENFDFERRLAGAESAIFSLCHMLGCGRSPGQGFRDSRRASHEHQDRKAQKAIKRISFVSTCYGTLDEKDPWRVSLT